jgi:hypothetical protein
MRARLQAPADGTVIAMSAARHSRLTAAVRLFRTRARKACRVTGSSTGAGTMKFAFRFPPSLPQLLGSLTVFGGLLVSLAYIDDRVKHKMLELMYGSGSVNSLSYRIADLGDTVWSALQHQSLENAPLVIFATVGGVLFLFMVRT